MNPNQLKTVLFLGILTSLVLVVGGLIGGKAGMLIALLIAGGINLGSWWFSDRIVLWMYGARKIEEHENPRLYRLVREVAQLANITMPRVYIIPSASPNAFATGRSPEKAAVAATGGILNLLDDEELRGVIAHEISHITNRDTLIATIAATLAGVISYIAYMARWGAIFGCFGGRDRKDNMIEIIALGILTPIIAAIIQLAISRSREYLADESGARLLHNGEALARALEKIDAGVNRWPMIDGNKAAAALFIANPFRGNALLSLFSTHPPMDERVKRLREMRFEH